MTNKYPFYSSKHLRHLIKNFNHREPGYSLLLHALLDFVKYKEYNVMTNYFLNNLEDVSNKHVVILLNILYGNML